jgi:8-amino-7-oxononanoate synthase
MHLLSGSLFVLPVKHPIVPSGESRLRITFHAENTAVQVVNLVEQIFVWVEEAMAIEEGRTEHQVTRAAREVYAWMRLEGLKGYGMV